MKTYLLPAIIAATLTSTMASAIEKEAYCREFTQTFTIGKEAQEGVGTACLQADGAWKIISQKSSATEGVIEEAGQKQKSEVKYIIREEELHVVPRVVIFAPGHKWHRKPVKHRQRWHW